MRILVVNVGSSSVKVSAVTDGEVAASDDLGDATRDALAGFISQHGPFDAVGHRDVHGGTDLVAATRIDDDVERRIEALTPLAPLHQPPALAGIRAARSLLPDVAQFACFDPAFHAALPAAAAMYAVPGAWRERWGVRRYGFHGLSHAYASRRAAQLTGGRRVVTCHLGAGASLAAVLDGRSVDPTMGVSPLEGLVMATRSGSVDPGLLLWLLEREELTVGEMSEALEHDSGLLALAGTADMQELLARSDDAARLALDVYIHRLRAGIAAMTASLGGIGVLVFTGGGGERSPQVRAAAAAGLGFLGVRVDDGRNASADDDRDVSAEDAAVRSLVIHAREDLEIARQVRRVVSARIRG